ncbi:MAG: hypothetical protein JZU63_02070, partial [Rhodoferax sp.]|nr:hypothetical protein [Rhodoferax sp.]
ITGNTTLYSGTVTSSGTQTYGDATSDSITLKAGTSLSTSNDNLTFNGSLDSDSTNRILNISIGTGTLAFKAAVGASSALAATTISAGILTADSSLYTVGTTSISTVNSGTGTQTYSGFVKLGGATSFSTNNSNLTFASTLNSDSTGAKALTISTGTGTIAFDAAVGNLYAIGTTTITGGILNAASTLYMAGTTSSISTGGAQTYTGAVTLGASSGSTFQTMANNNITFSSTLNGDALSRA